MYGTRRSVHVLGKPDVLHRTLLYEETNLHASGTIPTDVSRDSRLEAVS
jgi:hypothetical protein